MAQNIEYFQLEIGIVGGGIGGLSAAVALSKLGHRVTIFEAASKLSQVRLILCLLFKRDYESNLNLKKIGAGIQMTPNASKHLINWGVCQDFINPNSRFPCFKVRRWSDGEIIGRMETEIHYEKFGGPYIQLHRADLQEGLVKVATENGVQLNVNSRVVDFDFGQPTIILEDGRRVDVDLVIAADGQSKMSFLMKKKKRKNELADFVGIKSVGRCKLSGAPAPETTSTGLAVFRTTLDIEVVKSYPDLHHLVNEPGISLWWVFI